MLPKKIDDKALAVSIADALKENHQDVISTIKNISHVTGINPETIAKWHKQQNPPKAAHLLTLSGYYPAVLKAVTEIIGWPELWDAALRENIPQRMHIRLQEKSAFYRPRGDKSVTPQNPEDAVFCPLLHARQLWFLEEVRKGRHVCSIDLASTWDITVRTAKRDISMLVTAGFIQFHRSGRGGWYELQPKPRKIRKMPIP